MSLNGVGAVDTAHPFSCPVIDVTVYVATAEMTMSRVIVKTIGRTWLDDFTATRSVRFGVIGFEAGTHAGYALYHSQLPWFC